MPGTLTLSFDLELAWGEFYRRPVDVARLLAARRAFPDLLSLLRRTGMSATFAVVGHLLLDGCDGHRDMPSARPSWRPGDWYAGDPCSDEATDPAWYAPSLVRMIRAAEQLHDVGAHGFSHLPLDDPAVGCEVAAAELAACSHLLGTSPAGLSFVYPRNGIKYVELLQPNGFGCFRAAEERWYSRTVRPVRKVAHMVDQALAVTPSVGRSRWEVGVRVVPSSMLFLSREGFRHLLPMKSRVVRACRGLDRAVATGETFHLWMHVEDLVPDVAVMLAGLEVVLQRAAAMVARGELVVRTMAQGGDVSA